MKGRHKVLTRLRVVTGAMSRDASYIIKIMKNQRKRNNCNGVEALLSRETSNQL